MTDPDNRPDNRPDNNEEWKDMKSQWQSGSVAESFMTEKLRWSLRLRMIGSWVWLSLEIASFITLAVLAAIQWAMGQPGVAAALTLLNIVAIGASVWARRSPLRSARGSLMELIDLTIQRARRSERFAWAQYLTTGACMAYVLALYFSDVGDSLAAYHDAGRATVALCIFAVYAVGVGFYHRKARRRARRFLELRDRFVGNGKA
jgi:hypothetical protein